MYVCESRRYVCPPMPLVKRALCAYMCVCTYVFKCVRLLCAYLYVHVRMWVCSVRICVYVVYFVRICMYAYMYVGLFMRMYVCCMTLWQWKQHLNALSGTVWQTIIQAHVYGFVCMHVVCVHIRIQHDLSWGLQMLHSILWTRTRDTRSDFRVNIPRAWTFCFQEYGITESESERFYVHRWRNIPTRAYSFPAHSWNLGSPCVVQ
jgi:hypothetical protein